MVRPAYVMTGTQFYRARPKPTGVTRREVRAAIVRLLLENPRADAVTLISIVDEAAIRSDVKNNDRYLRQAWRTERAILLADLGDMVRSNEEWGVILVAIDMQETGRSETEIRAFLDDQAPHREGRVCPTCGVPIGKPCLETEATPVIWGLANTRSSRTTRLIPHESRVQP